MPAARVRGQYEVTPGSFIGWDGADTGPNGDFVLIAEGAGKAIKVTATERSSSLSATANVTIESVTAPTPVTLLLPPAGTVTGTVYDAAGSPMANASVSFSGPEKPYGFSVKTDAQGVYRSDYVRVGKLRIQAKHPTLQVYGTGGGVLAREGDTATVDIRLPATSTVRGRVFGTDGAPLANAYVEARNFDHNGPLGFANSYDFTDASGNYELTNMQVGQLLLGAENTANPKGALAELVLTDSQPGAVDLTIGNAHSLGWDEYDLDGADGFRYDVDDNGSFYNGGKADGSLSDAYDWSSELIVDGYYFDDLYFGWLEDNGREVVNGPWKVWGLKAVRKVFSPAGGGFARTLEILTNTTGEDMTVRVMNEVDLGPDEQTRVVVAPAETDNRFAVTDFPNTCCNPTLAHVYDGPGARLSSAPVPFVTGKDIFRYDWTVTIPAGRTVILMHFAVQRGRTDSAGARAQAEALVNLSDPAALEGMSDEEKSQVVNFQIPSAQAQLKSAPAAAGAEARATSSSPAPRVPPTQKRPPAVGAGGLRRVERPIASLGLGAVRRRDR